VVPTSTTTTVPPTSTTAAPTTTQAAIPRTTTTTLPLDQPILHPALKGIVTSWPARTRTGAAFGLLAGSRKLTVLVTSTTAFREARVARANLSYVVPGVTLLLDGRSTRGGFAASLIGIVPQPVVTVTGSVVGASPGYHADGVANFEVRAGTSRLTVYVEQKSTRFDDRAVRSPALADVVLGAHVVLRGTRGWPRTVLYASSVTVEPASG
jgi:hypothetical protein